MDDRQKQTEGCFSYKWARRETYESGAVKKRAYQWLVERYFGTEEARSRFLAEARGSRILDAGCGSGFSALLLFGEHLNEMEYLGVDISDSVEVGRERFKEARVRGEFLKESIATMRLGREFDVIFSEGVLHHASHPFEAFRNLVDHLAPGGTVMFYVYRKKAPIREFADDMVREKIRPLGDEEAWNRLIPLSKLGKAIGDLNCEVVVEEDVELLGIPAGKYNLQRLLYWYFIKMFYDKDFAVDEMNHINFDWYRPSNCHRFHPDEIERWLAGTGLAKLRFVVEEAGVTVVAKKG